MTDSIVVIRSRYLRLTKTIYADGLIKGYDQARTFDLFEMRIADFAELRELLVRLLPQPSCAVVFGGICRPVSGSLCA